MMSDRKITCLLPLLAALGAAPAHADDTGMLGNIKRHVTVASSVPDNGDQNPYAIVVAPVSAGKISKDDVLIDNFNNQGNLQGLGSTIVQYNPTTKKTMLFARLPSQLEDCPGGIGLSTAMTMLKTGWVIVGSTPSHDGTTETKGAGCLLVLDPNGNLVSVINGANINGPWGNMAVEDRGATATLFVSNAGFEVPSWRIRDPATGQPVIVAKATVLRIRLAMADGKPPVVTDETVVGSGFGQRADKDVFLIGPTGLALADGTLYVSDALANRVVAIDQATSRTASAGTGREVTKDGLLHRPLAMCLAPNGHLLVTNGLNGQVVEIDPVAGKQIRARWVDANKAQTPPGNGDLFGIAMTPAGDGFYFVEDEVNTLVLAR